MARRNGKPCEWCAEDMIRMQETDGQLGMDVEIYPNNNLVSITRTVLMRTGNTVKPA